MKYKVFAGLSGGFGGSRHIYTDTFNSYEEAMDEAFQESCRIYESYGGMYGIRTWDDCAKSFLADNEMDEETDTSTLNSDDMEVINESYADAREGWLCYHVEEVDDEEEDDE